MARIIRRHRVPGCVAACGGSGVFRVSGETEASVLVCGTLPLRVNQRQRVPVLPDGLGYQVQIRVREIGIGSRGGNVFAVRLVALDRNFHGRMVQQERPRVTVLRGGGLFRVQNFQRRRRVVGRAVLRDGLRDFFRVHACHVLFRHVQEMEPIPVTVKIIRGNLAAAVRQGKLVDLRNAGVIRADSRVFLHGDGVQRPASGRRRPYVLRQRDRGTRRKDRHRRSAGQSE